MSTNRTNLARKLDDIDVPAWPKPPGTVVAFRRKPTLTTRVVDVYDGAGDHIAVYSVCLEDDGCLDCEYEEMALVIAEQSGRVSEDEWHLLVARCHRDI